MPTTIAIVDHYAKRIDQAADQTKAIRISAHSIYEAIDAKIDLERLLRRMARDLRSQRLTH